MANTPSQIDLSGETLAQFLAKVVSDGTYANVVQDKKADQPGLEVTATACTGAMGQLVANIYDDLLIAAYPLLRALAVLPKAEGSYTSDGVTFESVMDLGPLAAGEGKGVILIATATIDNGGTTQSSTVINVASAENVAGVIGVTQGPNALGTIPGFKAEIAGGGSLTLELVTAYAGDVNYSVCVIALNTVAQPTP